MLNLNNNNEVPQDDENDEAPQQGVVYGNFEEHFIQNYFNDQEQLAPDCAIG